MKLLPTKVLPMKALPMKALPTKALPIALALCASLPLSLSAQVAPGAHSAIVTDGMSNVPEAVALPPQARMLVDAIDIPLTPEHVARAGLTESMAAALAADTAGKRYTRVRAVGALGIFGTDSARRLIELLATADADEQVRVQAVISLARIWGTDDREAVVGFLTERLGDAPAVVDDAIARELSRLYR